MAQYVPNTTAAIRYTAVNKPSLDQEDTGKQMKDKIISDGDLSYE